MNPWQLAQQLKNELQTVVWPSGSGDLVFGTRSVHVFAGTPNEEQIPPGFPWCMVGIGTGDADDSHPEFIVQQFTILTAAEVAGDPQGEFALIGGSVADLGKSAGRGVGEIADRVRAAVQNLTGADGVQLLVSSVSTGSPTPIGRGRHLVIDELTVSALCTSQPFYTAPQRLNHNGTAWSWTGTQCSNRFDFLQFRMYSKSGALPSTAPGDGTLVYSGAPAGFTGTSTTGLTYTVFADYNARGATLVGSTPVIEGSSSPEVGSYKVNA
jgi:hypothetical protein